MKKRDWFPFYYEWLSEEPVCRFTVEQHGIFAILLCVQWADGGVPDDVEKLARILRLPPEKMRSHWVDLKKAFVPHPVIPGTLIHLGLHQVLQLMRRGGWRS